MNRYERLNRHLTIADGFGDCMDREQDRESVQDLLGLKLPIFLNNNASEAIRAQCFPQIISHIRIKALKITFRPQWAKTLH